MAKAGTEYQHVVAEVVKALEPGAEVKEGQWVQGPDGQREIDVEVRGAIEGTSRFVLVECKDWKRPVDIQEIDKLDSKRKDVGADECVIYSNSGFTPQAVRKAGRVGIQAASAIKTGDGRVKGRLAMFFVAKRSAIQSLRMVIYPSEQSQGKIPDHWTPSDLLYDGAPLVNWLRPRTLELVRQHPEATQLREQIAFKREVSCALKGKAIVLRGFGYQVSCQHDWVGQVITVELTMGLFDHFRRRITVPNGHAYALTDIDNQAWVPTEAPELSELEPNSFRIDMTILATAIPVVSGAASPAVDELIGEHAVEAQ